MFSSVQFCRSVVSLCDPMECSKPGLPVHPNPGEYSNSCPLSQWCHLTISYSVVSFSCHPLFLLPSPFPLAFYLSQHQGLFKWVSSSHHVAKVLEFQLYHQSFQWISGLISFRMDWFSLLAVWSTLKSLLQHHTSRASFLWHSGFFIVQLSHPYMTTGKAIALTRRTFVGMD